MGMRVTRTILAAQAVATLAAAIIAYGVAGPGAALAAVAGGAIGMAGTAWFSHRMFAAKPGTPAPRMVRVFYRAEVVKILFTLALFAAAIAWLELAFLPLLGGYAATSVAWWAALPWITDETSGT